MAFKPMDTSNGTGTLGQLLDEVRKTNAIGQKSLDQLMNHAKGVLSAVSPASAAVAGTVAAGVAGNMQQVQKVQRERQKQAAETYQEYEKFMQQGHAQMTRSIIRVTKDLNSRKKKRERITEEIGEVSAHHEHGREYSETKAEGTLARRMKDVATELKESNKSKDKKEKKKGDLSDDLLWASKKVAPYAAAAYATTKFMAPGQSQVGDSSSVHQSALQSGVANYSNPLYWLGNAAMNPISSLQTMWENISGIAKGVR